MDIQMNARLIEMENTEKRGAHRRPRLFWVVTALAVVVLAGSSLMYAWGGGKSSGKAAAAKADAAKEAEAKKAPIPVSVAAVETGAVSSYLTATANLVPDNEVKVLAESEGRVGRLTVDEGQYVAKGQIMASLIHEDAEIAASKARLKVENTRLVHDRGSRMVREGLISQESFDRMTMEHDVARQELAEAQHRISKTAVRAPFSGRVTLRTVEVGQHVRPGDELFTVADFEPLVAYIYMAEKDALGMKPGREARITLKANEDVRFKGRIRQISPVVDAATGTVKVTVEAVSPPDIVRPGGFVTVDIVRETRSASLLLPREAVLRELRSAHVFVAKNGKAERRDVTLGLEEGSRIEITSGIAAGEKVVVAGQGSLKPGSEIKVIQAAAAPTATAAERAAEAR
jgi:membrane fusion protein (multidrug efflux system)